MQHILAPPPDEEGKLMSPEHIGTLLSANVCLSTLQIVNTVRGVPFPPFSLNQCLISNPTFFYVSTFKFPSVETRGWLTVLTEENQSLNLNAFFYLRVCLIASVKKDLSINSPCSILRDTHKMRTNQSWWLLV